MSSVVSFKKNINNLRALAVIGVVLFHFSHNWIPGGFAGVDAFFVISGYLMTSIIFKKIDLKTFSIIDFYKARAHRIIPPLLLLCVVMAVFGLIYLSPYEFERLSKHIAAAVTFTSNFIFFKESGYFDAASNTKWLLHTWSLSAEWQFYIIYPIVIVTLLKLFRIGTVKFLIVLATLISLGISIFAVVSKNETYLNAGYYLLPTRAWEMMLGGIAFFFPLTNKKTASYIQYIGIGLIILSYYLFSESTPWPGYLALLPAIGSYLVVVSDTNETAFSKSKIMHYLGLWSYSIYLWHWPLVVGISTFELGTSGIVVGLVLSVLLGALSYYTIESINFKKLKGLKEYAYMPVAVILIAFGTHGFINKGYPTRYSEHFNEIAQTAKNSPTRSKCHANPHYTPEPICKLGAPKEQTTWASIGDSHTVELAYSMGNILNKHNDSLYQYSFSGCLPSHSTTEIFQTRCTKRYQSAVGKIIADQSISNVIIGHRWFSEKNQEMMNPGVSDIRNETLESLILTIEDLSKSKNVYVILPFPEPSKHINLLLSQYERKDDTFTEAEGETLNEYNERNELLIKKLSSYQFNENVKFIKPTDALCDTEKCFTVKDSKSMYFDDNHPSIYATALVAELIEKQAF